MDATEYYKKNAVLHSENDKPPQLVTGSEPYIAASWLRHEETKDKCLLDLGCGGVGFLSNMSEFYNECTGVDIVSQKN